MNRRQFTAAAAVAAATVSLAEAAIAATDDPAFAAIAEYRAHHSTWVMIRKANPEFAHWPRVEVRGRLIVTSIQAHAAREHYAKMPGASALVAEYDAAIATLEADEQRRVSAQISTGYHAAFKGWNKASNECAKSHPKPLPGPLLTLKSPPRMIAKNCATSPLMACAAYADKLANNSHFSRYKRGWQRAGPFLFL